MLTYSKQNQRHEQKRKMEKYLPRMTATRTNKNSRKNKLEKCTKNHTRLHGLPVVLPHGKFPFITSGTEACKWETSFFAISSLNFSINEESFVLFEEILLRRCARCLDESG